MNQRTFQEISDDVLRAREAQDGAALSRCAAELDALGTTEAQALAARSRGTVLILVDNNTAESLAQFRKALALYTALNDKESMAKTHRNVGAVNEELGQYAEALEHYQRSLQLFEETGNELGAARARSRIGIIMRDTGSNAEAFSLLRQSLETFENIGEPGDIALTLNNLGNILKNSGQYPEALAHYERAVQLFEESGDRNGIALVTDNIASVYYMIEDHVRAIEYRQHALELYEALGDMRKFAVTLSNMANIYVQQNDLDRAISNYRKALELVKHHGSQYDVAHTTGGLLGVLLRKGPSDETDQLLASMDAMSIPSVTTKLYLEASRALLQEHRGMLDDAKNTLLASLVVAQECNLPFDQVGIHDQLRDLALKMNDLAAYVEHNNAFQRITEEINGKEMATKLAMQAKQREIDAREREHAQHMAVLHSTLPKEVAARVARGEVVNDHYDNASVIFLDIVGFTELSSTMSSQEVIALLDDVFTQCDAICATHGVTKIKTIGDSYMCVSFDSVINAAFCALDMSRISISHAVSHEVSHTVSHEVAFRIGMHCGPVTAGVIGKERMQYDVWGDTVNVASRMESAGEPGKVHVSEALALNLKKNTESRTQDPILHAVSHNVSHEVSHAEGVLPVSHSVSHASVPQSELGTRHSSLVTQLRGSIDIKGKGPMNTYWLEER